ncbi:MULTISPECIES: hypothetical protein [unclassified Thiocapsa]|uniref:hypothetical protein n=1 Tax=unclassified Thiocapsa TaxID=2641286 RepID=UPI0035B389AA
MMTLNIHHVQTIDLGCVRSYFCRDSNRLFYAREIEITNSSGCFRMSLFSDQATELNLQQANESTIPTMSEAA